MQNSGTESELFGKPMKNNFQIQNWLFSFTAYFSLFRNFANIWFTAFILIDTTEF